ncbi:phosphatidate cytidylyltransferase [Vigna unguiculata]|uniref:phosphatidate cytidylyltransferase n=1 Tax=Vigna unguiculata TaxID=3917 RepID=A0A4D6KMU9_VIGUN|nr:phosphatidate cytidylyltransferase [Vigna unguiculata]
MAHLRLTNSLSSPLPKKLVPFSSQSLILHHPFYFAKPKPLIRFARRTGPPLVLAAVGQAEPNHLPQTNAPQVRPEEEEDLPSKSQQQGSQLRNRVVFGLGIGIGVGGVVLAGGWVFATAIAAAVFTGAREYFELVRSRGITEGMTPPPRYVSRVCSVICALMPLFVMYRGHVDVSVTSAAFVLATALLLQRGSPRFAQLSSAIFGLFYCGYLPSFWVKLRCGLAAPALNTRQGATWPILLGGQAHWTVGLVATLITISSIIAADTFAFLGGKGGMHSIKQCF